MRAVKEYDLCILGLGSVGFWKFWEGIDNLRRH